MYTLYGVVHIWRFLPITENSEFGLLLVEIFARHSDVMKFSAREHCG
jgi:hypothetical protein